MLSQKEIEIKNDSIIINSRNESLIIREWGNNTVRIISSPNHNFRLNNELGIEELSKNGKSSIEINNSKNVIELKNNDLRVVYNGEYLTFYNKDKVILKEYTRKQSKVRRTIGVDDHIPIEDEATSSLNISPREFKFKSENSYSATLRFEANNNERIYGLGGYQEKNIDKNHGFYELMQRNSQTSIPFYISSENYGFIWNNASLGEAIFGKEQKIWRSNNTEIIDYIVTVGDNPKELLRNFTEMTGRAPKIEKDLLGLWQSKLRYQTLSELEEVYSQYKKRNIKLSVLVIDYFHWTADGDFEFDLEYWKGIDDFAKQIAKDGTKLMVSLWPTVNKNSKYYDYYKNNQMIIRSVSNKDNMFGDSEILDFSNPKTKEHLQKLLKENYKDLGVSLFWADQAEPEMTNYNHHEYQVYNGSLEKYGNKYPYYYIRAIQDDDVESYKLGFPTLIRSAWFNSQKYGALAWSGDIESSFDSLQRQIQISISMGITGIPWWTSDIAGFHSGDSSTDKFKELLIRWFQFAVFSPVLRMHGDRQPHTQKIGDSGGGVRTSGGPNEIWSFGNEAEKILTRYTRIRENLKEYILNLYDESHTNGYPLIRSLFFEFPEDKKAWKETTNYMFGEDLLIVPVTQENISKLSVYLPKDEEWMNVWTGEVYKGGKEYDIKITIEDLPVFCRVGSDVVKDREEIFIKSN